MYCEAGSAQDSQKLYQMKTRKQMIRNKEEMKNGNSRYRFRNLFQFSSSGNDGRWKSRGDYE